jgi:exodeoxyribonuclease V gamma subunit
LYLGDDLSALPEREPFDLNNLDRWRLATEWLEHLAQGRPEASRIEVLRARGSLPHFVSGERAYEQLEHEVKTIARVRLTYTQEAPPKAVDVDLRIGGVRLTGRIGDLWPSGHVRAQYSQLGSRHELRQFVRQVVLRCLAEQQPGLNLPAESILIGRKKQAGIGLVRFALEHPASEVLEDLLQLYMEALGGPLALFPFASRAFAEQMLVKDAQPEAALRAARGKFGDRFGSVDFEQDLGDDYVQQLFGDFDHMHGVAAGSFERTALRLYEPLLKARHDGDS